MREKLTYLLNLNGQLQISDLSLQEIRDIYVPYYQVEIYNIENLNLYKSYDREQKIRLFHFDKLLYYFKDDKANIKFTNYVFQLSESFDETQMRMRKFNRIK